MKKKIVSILLVISMLLTLSGCVKFNATMDIKPTKSMNFSIIYAFDTSIFGDEMGDMTNNEMIEEMKNKGFTMEDYQDGNMKGFKISKKIKNIDEVSSNNDVEFDLSGFANDSNSDIKIFKVKKGLIKNTYIAKLTFNTSDSGIDDSMSFDNEDLSDMGMNIDYSSMMANLDLSFNLNLPYKAKSSNATSVDGKKLTWNLNNITTANDQKLEFEFELYNLVFLGIIGGGILLLIILIIIIFTRKKNEAKPKKVETLESVNTDSVDQTNLNNLEQVNNQVNQINDSMSIDRLDEQNLDSMNIEELNVPDNIENPVQISTQSDLSMNIDTPKVDILDTDELDNNLMMENTNDLNDSSSQNNNSVSSTNLEMNKNSEAINMMKHDNQTNIQPMPPFGDQNPDDILNIAFGDSFATRNNSSNKTDSL